MENKTKHPFLAIIIVFLAILIISGACSNDDPNNSTVEKVTTDYNSERTTDPPESSKPEQNTLKITLAAGQKGEYGRTITYNAGTEFEESFYAYYVPAGTYTMLNAGKYPAQINVYSNETVYNENGWEEPAHGASKLADPGKTVTMTVGVDEHIEITGSARIVLVLVGPPVTEPPVTEPIVRCEIVSGHFFSGEWISEDEIWFEIFTIVENTGNVTIDLSCSFDIEDENGNLITTVEYANIYPGVVAPGERAVCRRGLSLPGGSLDTEYNIFANVECTKSKGSKVDLEFSDIRMVERFGTIEMTGRVENTTGEPQENLCIGAILYDANGRVIGVMRTYPDDIPDGERVSFKINNMDSYDDVVPSDVAEYQMFAYRTR